MSSIILSAVLTLVGALSERTSITDQYFVKYSPFKDTTMDANAQLRERLTAEPDPFDPEPTPDELE